MTVTVSELLVRYLEHLGIDTLFGMPGAHVLPIYDQLRASSIQTVLAKHEQGAAFMAGGFARHAHRPAGCIATAGPGATNLITSIANAYAERLPVLAITGEAPTYMFGKGGLQESSGEGGAIDQGALFASITRYQKRIERTDYLGQVLYQATRALYGAEPGPVLLTVPYNVQKETLDDEMAERFLEHLPKPVTRRQGATEPVEELAELIRAARYPVIVAGYGCIRAGARDLVARLSAELTIPVATSLKAKGVVAEDGPLALGCLGVTSNRQAYHYIVEHADLVVFLGAGLNERTSHLWDPKLLAGKKVAQVDNDIRQLGKVFKADVAIHGEMAEVLANLLDLLGADPGGANRLDRLDRHRSGEAGSPFEKSGKFVLVEQFFGALAARFPKDALIFDDNIVFAQSYLRVSGANHYYPNSGISSLGHAIPAAIGAQFHLRRRGQACPAFAILGDGGFQMCCMELMTAVNYRIPLNVVVFNNATMGLIRKNQFQLYAERYIDCDFVNPDFALLARSFGINHRKLESAADVANLLDEADLVDSINLIEIPLDKDAFPSYLSDR